MPDDAKEDLCIPIKSTSLVRGFLGYNVKYKKLYRFNNTGDRCKLVPNDAKEDLCIPIKCTSLVEAFLNII